jgi:hypothetical protein
VHHLVLQDVTGLTAGADQKEGDDVRPDRIDAPGNGSSGSDDQQIDSDQRPRPAVLPLAEFSRDRDALGLASRRGGLRQHMGRDLGLHSHGDAFLARRAA